MLGDIFEEGQWGDTEEFESFIKRFNSTFTVPNHTKLHVVVGNHDIGFHYGNVKINIFK